MSLSTPSSAASPLKRTVPLSFLVVAVVLVGGVAVVGAAGYVALHPAATPAKGPSSVSVTDDLGRTETVPYDPARVVVLSPSIVDAMFRLGLRGHIVGVDCYASTAGSEGISEDYSADQRAEWNLSESMCVTIGPSFDFESLLNRTPTLVLASTIVSVAAVEEIEQTYGIPVVMLQPPTVSGVLVDDSILATIFNVAPAATTLNAELSSELANLSAEVQGLGRLPSVLVTYDTDTSGYWTYGPGSFGESLIELAGAANIGANASIPYPEISGEAVLAANPTDVVYATGYGLNESSYSTAPFWAELSAVRGGNATGIDSNWITEPDPTMLLVGLPTLYAIFHPAG